MPVIRDATRLTAPAEPITGGSAGTRTEIRREDSGTAADTRGMQKSGVVPTTTSPRYGDWDGEGGDATALF